MQRIQDEFDKICIGDSSTKNISREFFFNYYINIIRLVSYRLKIV